MTTALELTTEQGQVVLGAAEPVPVLIKNAREKFLIISAEAYDKMRELLQVDEVEDSLLECEDLPDPP